MKRRRITTSTSEDYYMDKQLYPRCRKLHPRKKPIKMKFL